MTITSIHDCPNSSRLPRFIAFLGAIPQGRGQIIRFGRSVTKEMRHKPNVAFSRSPTQWIMALCRSLLSRVCFCWIRIIDRAVGYHGDERLDHLQKQRKMRPPGNFTTSFDGKNRGRCYDLVPVHSTQHHCVKSCNKSLPFSEGCSSRTGKIWS